MAEAVCTINDMNMHIATAAEEQNAVSEEINRNIVAIQQIVEQLNRATDESDETTQHVLAEEGILDRRRKAGTRVAANPVRRARLDIALIRDEIEARGLAFRHAVLSRETALPPPAVRARMGTAAEVALLHLRTLYTAGGAPYVYEDRWINPAVVPAVAGESFAAISPNEWLVREVPFEAGDFTFSAITSTPAEAAVLACATGIGLFVLDRTTRRAGRIITRLLPS